MMYQFHNYRQERTEQVQDLNAIMLQKQEFHKYVELQNGLWLNSVGDGTYYDDNGNWFAIVWDSIEGEEDEMRFVGFIKL